MYKVLLYLPFGAVYATEDASPNGKLITFNTIQEAERYGRSKGFVFEPVEIK